ncbi:DUF6551 family protein [Agrobacterium sp. OT33]|uniref:DUF6551 family protein n=1 Tax=Agrobacterium sp. OT33 TaxID=2815338 RepID=UPI001A8D67EC|nr:DUF6551 family protein [Agrobacterium sp. OT33]MBO0127910.1 ParB N-terminal domain-containing protein [Agrobacterium sp. OT33]
MTQQQSIPLAGGIRTWLNDGSAMPPWVCDRITEDKSPNGSFLIPTPLGTTRVHAGHVVIEHGGKLWCREPEEVPELLAGFTAEVVPEITAIGPGKSAQFGTKSKTGSGGKRGSERKIAFGTPRDTMPSIEWVHVTELTVDSSYQRSIDNNGSRRLIASIAANFDWRLCAPLVVSRRPDGSRVIIDGQHRWAAAVRRGDLLQLPCCLFTYGSPEGEARMFIVANRARKAMNRMDDFHAALAAGDEDALDIRRLVSEAGLAIARSTSSTAWKPGDVTFTSSIATALRRHGDAVVSAALTCMAEAYNGETLTHGASIFGALVRIYANPPEGFDPDEFVPTLRRFPMAELGEMVRDQKGGDARAFALSKAILKALNRADA